MLFLFKATVFAPAKWTSRRNLMSFLIGALKDALRQLLDNKQKFNIFTSYLHH